MKNQTALPSLTVNPSNVLPSLPPSLSPPPLLSPPLFSLLSLHLSPSGGRTLGVPKQAVEHQHHLAVRPIHRRTDITRGQRETRRDGRGEDSTKAPAADGRNRASASRPASLGAEASDRGRPWEQHLLRGSARSHRRPPARSSSSSSSGARPTARPQQQQQHQQPPHQQQAATQQQHRKWETPVCSRLFHGAKTFGDYILNKE